LWIPIDADAVRPAGISSSNREHDLAIARAFAIKDYLLTVFGPSASPVITDSGNGAHCDYAIDLANTPANTELIKQFLIALARRFDDAKVVIDQVNFNAARIWRLPGTLVCKGTNSAERPHRLAQLLEFPPTIELVPPEMLKAVGAEAAGSTLVQVPATIKPGRSEQALKKLMLADGARSGLTPAVMNAAGYAPVSAEFMLKLTAVGKFAGYEFPAYTIPNIHPLTGKRRGVRYRLLLSPGDPTGIRRYHQPDKQPNLLYFPPVKINALTWAEILADAKLPIVIVEGEKKALALCLAGIPAVAVTGVWSWVEGAQRSRADDTWEKVPRDLRAIPDIELLNPRDRDILLLYDSEVATKDGVKQACHALAGELVKRGAKPTQILLPSGPNDENVGADDWLLANKPFSFEKFEALERIEFIGARTLWDINAKYAYIYNPAGKIMRIETEDVPYLPPITLLRVPDFRTELANKRPNNVAEQFFLGQMGAKKGTDMNFADSWMKWLFRQSYTRIEYVPGHEKLANGAYNIWRGWGVEARKGDITLFRKLIEFIFGDSPAAIIKWFIQWLAWPIQNPGGKMHSSVLLTGPPGGGKNLIADYLMRRIYGHNFILLGPDRLLDNRFNTDLLGRQFIVADEVFTSDKVELENRLKALVTRTSQRIEPKGIDSYEVIDHANWIFLANQMEAMNIRDLDRRWFVRNQLNTKDNQLDKVKGWEGFSDRFIEWVNNGGAEAVFYHLKHKVDCSDFQPYKEPPMTSDKEEMIIIQRSLENAWAHELLEDYPAQLNPFFRNGLNYAQLALEAKARNLPAPLAFNSDLFELDVLRKHFADRHFNGALEKVSEHKIRYALKRVGAGALKKDQQVRLRDGERHRMWALRIVNRWRKASIGELKRYLNPFLKENEGEKSRKKKAKVVGRIPNKAEPPFENRVPRWGERG
jgi:Domain of unknown function (DUF3854)/Family of unknown function (DUF5906)